MNKRHILWFAVVLLVVGCFSGVAGAVECDISLIDNCTVSSSMVLDGGYHNLADDGYNGAVIINASNITLDCNGTTINGADSGYGIYHNGYDNVTIRNCTVTNYTYGVYINSSNSSTITNSIVTDNLYGIYLNSSSNSTITNNKIVSNLQNGINVNSLSTSSTSNVISSNILTSNSMVIYNLFNTTISNNTVTSANDHGIYIKSSDNNIISNNTAKLNNASSTCGMVISDSSNNTISNNNASNNYHGICISTSSNNTLFNNTASNNQINGIRLLLSSNNNLSQNIMFNNNRRNFMINEVMAAYTKSHFNNSIDTTNTVNGKPIYYFFDQQNLIVDDYDTEHITLAYCSNFTVRNNILTGGDGVHLFATNTTNITNNTIISSNTAGIYLDYSNNNTIFDNNVSYNIGGIYLYTYSSNNTITNNTLNWNTNQGLQLDGNNKNNTVTNNIINSNNNHGIYSAGSTNSGNITSNQVCYNSNLDLYLPGATGYTGDNNTCDKADEWNDTGTFGCTYSCPTAPTITSWYNNKTNNQSLSITINESESITFNITADQPVVTYNWYLDGVLQNHSYDNFTTSLNESGTYEVNLTVSNANGTSENKSWAITVKHPICSAQGGSYCSASQSCSGSWVSASDTSYCCIGNCYTPSGGGDGGGYTPPPPTSKPTPPVTITITKKAGNMEAGESKVVTFEEAETDISEIKINVKNNVSGVEITIQKYIDKPAHITHSPKPSTPTASGLTYSYLNITTTNITDEDISNATINFTVNKTWIAHNKINADSVKLTRYNNTSQGWTHLPTHKIGDDEGLVHYSAETPGFSIFAIVGEEVKEESSPTPTPSATPTPITTVKPAPAPAANMSATATPTPTPAPAGTDMALIGGAVAVLVIVVLAVVSILYKKQIMTNLEEMRKK